MFDAAEITQMKIWASMLDACTCQVIHNTETDRHAVQKHTCHHCLEWDRKLRELVVGTKPREEAKRKPARSSRRRAA